MSKITRQMMIGLVAIVLTAGGLCNTVFSGNQSAEKADNAVPLYTIEEVKTALIAYEETGAPGALLQDIMLPASKGTITLKLDESRIANNTSLSAFGAAETYYQELRNHGITEDQMQEMTYSEYEQLRSSWLLDTATIAAAKAKWPELSQVDLTQWTQGTYEHYCAEQETEILKNRFTEVQLSKLEAMGIELEDAGYLLKTYYTPNTLLAQPEATLRQQIENYYQFRLQRTLGADWRESARIA